MNDARPSGAQDRAAVLPVRRHVLLLALVLLVKGLYLFMLSDQGDEDFRAGRIAFRETDTWEYTDTFEPLIAGGDYERDHRMPGMGVVYVPLRLLFSKPVTMDIIVVLQTLLSALACYALALTVLTITRSSRMFYAALVLLTLCSFADALNALVLTEGFCLVSISLCWYLIVRHHGNGRLLPLFFAGLFLTWAVFLRPIYVVLVPMIALCIVWSYRKHLRTAFQRALVFVLPFLVIDGAWTWRNYNVHGEFHPLTNERYSKEFMRLPYYALQRFVTAYGGDHVFWNPKSDIRWYGFEQGTAVARIGDASGVPGPPAHVYTAQCNQDSLLLLAQQVRDLRATMHEQTPEREARIDALFEREERYRTAFIQEKPFQYHVMARARLLGHLVLHSGTSGFFAQPFAELPLWKKAFKLLQTVLYWCLWLPGLIGAFLFAWRSRDDLPRSALAWMVILGIVLHPFVVRLCELRYLIPTFQLTIVAAVLLFWHFAQKRGQQERPVTR